MWTKEDLQGKYIKITSQQDYETVIKVLEELGIQQDKEYLGEKYENRFNAVFVATKYGYFLTESKHSDIPIQQFYDYLASKTLKVEDLVEGEIYVGKNTIYKWNGKGNNLYRIFELNHFHKGNNPYWDVVSPDRIANSEEKKHLEVCITQNKFIPKEDLHLYDDITFELKSLQTIPEYGECIKNDLSNFTKGKIYKLENNSCVDNFGRIIHSIREDWFKPSTKEAFEAQNIPKFEVGKWYKFVWKWDNKWYYGQFEEYNYDSLKWSIWFRTDGSNFIKNPSFIKTELGEYFELTDLLEIQQYLPDGHIDKIKPMEKSLVGRYLKALVDSPQSTSFKKGEYTKILDFYYNDKRPNKYKIERDWCYTTDSSTTDEWELMPEGFEPPNKTSEWIPQVGEFYTLIDSEKNNPKWDSFKGILEVEEFDGEYVYPKNKDGIHQNVKLFRKCLPHEIPNTTQEVKEMSKEELLQEAKRKYPVGTKFYTSKTGVLRTIKDEPVLFSSSPLIICCKTKENSFNAEIYTNGKWAEIVELPKDYVIGIDPIKKYPLTSNEAFKIDNNQVNLLVKQSESVTLKRTENEVNIKVTNLKTIKI